jgi:hypothetical protein
MKPDCESLEVLIVRQKKGERQMMMMRWRVEIGSLFIPTVVMFTVAISRFLFIILGKTVN